MLINLKTDTTTQKSVDFKSLYLNLRAARIIFAISVSVLQQNGKLAPAFTKLRIELQPFT